MPRQRSRGPVIAAVLVILVGGILAFLYLPTKPAPPVEAPLVTNLSPPKPAPDVVIQPTNPIVPKTNVAPPPPAPTTGALVILSDPANVEVYKAGQKVGETPYQTNGLPPGPLTYQLGNLTRTGMVTITVVAGGTNKSKVNLTPRTGTLVVNSDPTHAEIWFAGRRVGYTPFSNNWDVGDFELTLRHPPLSEMQAQVTVAAETSCQTNISFIYGGLGIQSDPTGADVLFNGQLAGLTPFRTNLLLPGTLAFQLRLTNYEPSDITIQVPKNHSFAETNIQLQHVPVVTPISVVPPIAEVKPVGTGLVVTNEGRVVWTNRFGMVFFKMPTNEFWIEMALATPQQFNEVAIGNDQTIPKVPLDKAELFASNLTALLQKNNEFPPGCETWQFGIPTTNQWRLAAGIKLLEFKKVKRYEWCRNATSQESKLFFAKYNEDEDKFVIKEIVLSDAPDGLALRLVLTPPGPPPHQTL